MTSLWGACGKVVRKPVNWAQNSWSGLPKWARAFRVLCACYPGNAEFGPIVAARERWNAAHEVGRREIKMLASGAAIQAPAGRIHSRHHHSLSLWCGDEAGEEKARDAYGDGAGC